MRKERSGVIVNFSSIAAFRTAEGSAYYGATKAALAEVAEYEKYSVLTDE